MENILPVQSNAFDNAKLNILLIKEGIKEKTRLFTIDFDIKKLVSLIRKNNTNDTIIKNLFSEIKNTNVVGISIGKCKIDGKEYLFNESLNIINNKGFEKIIEVYEDSGKILFQALDDALDGHYAIYDTESFSRISEMSDKKIYRKYL